VSVDVRLAQREDAEEKGEKRQAGGDEAGVAETVLRQKPAERRSDDEAQADARSHPAHIARPLGGSGDVGDVGLGGGDGAGEEPAEDARREHQP
jgi:hypothetical protein